MGEGRSRSFYVLAAFFTAYVLFLYGPMFAIYILSFQGPDGGRLLSVLLLVDFVLVWTAGLVVLVVVYYAVRLRRLVNGVYRAFVPGGYDHFGGTSSGKRINGFLSFSN